MSERILQLEPGASQDFAPGAPIVCAAGGAPFALSAGSAELFLRAAQGQWFLGTLGPGDAVFPAMPDTAGLMLVAPGPIRVAALADETAHSAAWCERIAALLGADGAAPEPSDAAQLNARLLASCRSSVARRDEADLARLAGAQSEADRPGKAGRTLAELIDICASDLGAQALPPGAAGAGASLEDTPALARRLGLSVRRLTLTAGWQHSDQGPLLLRDGETGALACALWRRGGYRLHGSDVIDPELAGSFEPLAYALSAPLPAGVDDFASLARYVVARNLPEITSIGLAATLVAVLGAITPLATGWILSDIAPSGNAGLLLAVGLALFFAGFVRYVLETVRGVATSRMQGKTSARLSTALFDRVLRLPPSFFREFAAGDLNQRLSGIDAIRQLVLSTFLSAGLSAVLSIFYFAVLAWYGIALALISAALICVYVLIVVVTRSLQMPLIRRSFALDGQLAERNYEMIGAVAKLRSAAAEHRALARWAVLYGEERALEQAAGNIQAFSSASRTGWQLLTQVILFAAVAKLAGSALDPGSFVAFLVAFGSFQGAFVTLSSQLIELYAAQPQIDRAMPILRAQPEIGEDRADPGQLKGAISVRDVCFGYVAGQPLVLDGVSLDVRPGEHLALVGGSGSGKSTLLRLLLGFERPGRGSIFYDSEDLAEIDLGLLRAQLGVVLQSSSLFAGSIIDNIRGPHDASLSLCMEAAERAGLARDLEQFPMGMHTPITEGAAVLSGGQRQRILIARALVTRPKILFFDEATSALDNRSQAVVAQTLDAMDATRITIAHRLSTIEQADTICVLKDGRIAERGTYDELIAADGVFAQLARRQLMEQG